MTEQSIQQPSSTKRNRSLIMGGALLFAMAVALTVYLVYLKDVLSLDSLVAAKDSLGAFAADNIWWMFFAALLAYALITAILLPSVLWLSIAISYTFGAAFGVWTGALVATAAIYLGVLVGLPAAFLAVRYIVGDGLRARFGDKIDRIARGVEEDALFYIIAMRLMPIIPYILVNAAPALVRVKLSTHMLASAIGLLPGTFVYAYLGASLTTALQPQGIQASWHIAVAFAGLGLLSLIPIVLKRIAPNLFSAKSEGA